MVQIDSVGKYITRNGFTVEINEIDGKGSCSCKGYLIKYDTLGRKRRYWSIWQPNGKYVFIGEHPRDIISKA